jgi:hypothetical protein
MYARFDALTCRQDADKREHNSRRTPASDLLQVALLPGIFQSVNRSVLRTQRPDSRPVAGVATTTNDHVPTSQQGLAASGMYVVVAVGPLGWHGGRGNGLYFAGLDTLLG